ncbi:MAG: GAF domain-containing protein, partial [Anaerolineaceae bacterium]|nr:GAF domain-containing protein [Anaerolineaceae bacterium]
INKIGQELSKLTNAADIYPVVASTIENVLENKNLIIAIRETNERAIKYPVYKENGKSYEKAPSERPESLIEGILNAEEIIYSNKDVLGKLENLNIGLPSHIPHAFAGIPFVIGDRAKGAILVQDFEKENSFTPAVLDLLSTITTQTSTSLENAFLFEDIRNAVSSLENRERYQANIAKAVAILTESGSPAMASVLEALADASQATRISFAKIQEDEHGLCWKLDQTWQSTEIPPYSIGPLPEHLPLTTLQYLGDQLREKTFTAISTNDLNGAEHDLFSSLGSKSILALGIRGNQATPSLLLFEEHKNKRKWQTEEIDVLQVAADAISSTILREDLLLQVQSSLDETENLYNASHRLALANDFQEMVSSIAQGLRVAAINRGILVLFDHDSQNKVNSMRVAANWYSETGSPPPPVGTEYMPTVYQRVFLTPNPIFIDDLKDPSGDRALHDIFNQQRIGSMAILPLWAGKRQLGVFLLESEEKHSFSSSEIRSIPSLVDQMATSVENLRLFEQTQVALSETEHLYKITNGISQALGPQDLARLVAENILPKNVDRVSLYSVLNSPDNEIADLECIGLVDVRGESSGIGDRIPINSLPLMKALVGDSLILPDLATSDVDAISKKTLQQLSMESVCFIPLRSTEKLIGLILLSARRPSEFDRDEIHLIQIV